MKVSGEAVKYWYTQVIAEYILGLSVPDKVTILSNALTAIDVYGIISPLAVVISLIDIVV